VHEPGTDDNIGNPAITRSKLMGKGRLEAFSDGVIAIIITATL
jgi:uncharacterized membrane protein